MSQDYAKRRQPAHVKQSAMPSFVWFVGGFFAGVFASFLVYVWRDLPTDIEVDAIVSKPSVESATPKVEDMQWDFYDIFPKSEVPIVEEYGPTGQKVQVARPSAYLLQAGSFRAAKDAEQLRAELILLGMTAFTRDAQKDGVTWHRVLVGPIESELEMTRLKRKLAEADIASIALRVTP